MALNSNKLYTLLLVACMAGYIWLYYGINSYQLGKESFEACLIKHVTNIPCPSCGSTRSVMSLIKGNFKNALLINPLGYVVTFIMVLCPVWILMDIISKKKTLFMFYQKIELYLKKPQIAIPLITLITINWIWNIIKGL